MAVRTIKGDGTGDHTSLSAWEADVQTDTGGTLTEIETAECYAFADTTAVTIDGCTTSSTAYHRIVAATGAEAQMPWNTTVAYRLTPAANTTPLTLSDPFVRVERIQVELATGASARFGIVIGAGITDIRINGCYIRATGAGGGASDGIRSAGSNIFVNNTVIQGFPSDGVSSTSGSDAHFYYNVTVANSPNGFSVGGGSRLKNCLATNCTTDFTSAHADSNFNASEDTTAPGANSRISQTFTFINAASGDYRLTATDAGARGHGTDLSADADLPFSTDWSQHTRSDWSIGASEPPLVVTTIVGSAAEPDENYTSLSAWEAGQAGDLMALHEIHEACCRGFQDTTAATLDGSTTDAHRYLRVYADAGAEAQLPYSSSAYRIEISGASLCLSLDDPFTRIERIQLSYDFSGSNGGCVTLWASDCRVVGVVARSTVNGVLCRQYRTNLSGGSGSSRGYFINCVALGSTSTDVNNNGFAVNGGGTTYVYNCTSVRSQHGFKTLGTGVVKNCASYGALGNDFDGTWDASSTNNAGEDGTAPNTNEVTITADPFVDYANGDLHIASGSELEDAGIDLSADAAFPFSTDFDGDTRTGTWDIGADEAAAGGGATTLTPSAVAAAFSVAAPSVIKGTVTVVPASVAAAWDIPDPTVTQGATVLTPSPASAGVVISSPTVLKGTILLTPDAAEAVLGIPAATVVTGAVLITPDPAFGQFLMRTVIVDGGELGTAVILRKRRRRPGTERRP